MRKDMKISIVKTGRLIFEEVTKVEQNPDGTVTVYFESGEQITLSQEEAHALGLL
jgi:hypothetical protein